MNSNESDGKQSQSDAMGFNVNPSSPDGVGIKDDGKTGLGTQEKKIKMTQEQFESKEYDMKHAKTGRAIVINNKNFQKRKRDSESNKTRKHTDRDKDAIVKVLEELDFEGVNYKNMKTQTVENKMVFEDVQKEDLIRLFNDAGNDMINDYTDMDCFICVILSYGEQGLIYCPGNPNKQEDDPVELKKLMEPLKGDRCKTLVMKPKLFFIQGCPYEDKDEALGFGPTEEMPTVTKKVPVEADFLIQSCNLHAYTGWIQDKTSWYIRALCKALKEFCIDKVTKNQRSLHILTVLTRVNRFVVQFMAEENCKPSRDLQIPLVTSLLTKHMYFYPKKQNLN